MTKDGISTTFFGDEGGAAHDRAGTRESSVAKAVSPQPSNFDGTLSHHEACRTAEIALMSLRRNDSSTASSATD